MCSCPPETPKTVAKTDGDCAFSFPVTPPSEPPAAAEPGHVFGAWPSLKNSSHKHSSKVCRGLYHCSQSVADLARLRGLGAFPAACRAGILCFCLRHLALISSED